MEEYLVKQSGNTDYKLEYFEIGTQTNIDKLLNLNIESLYSNKYTII